MTAAFPAMIWQNPRRALDLTHRGVIMGILNVTPDSFSDGGRFLDLGPALEQAQRMIEEGAQIIDVGGESTRPGADLVCVEEELARVVPSIRALRGQAPGILISIDTSKAAVAAAALEAGADIINDVTALRGDPAMAAVAAASGAGLCLMHMRGTPQNMQDNPRYQDVVVEVRQFLEERLSDAVACGIRREQVALDPGIGFGKTARHNFELLRHSGALTATMPDRPLLIGVSRKSFLGGDPDERRWSTVALTSLLRSRGARIFRVHDVRPNLEALRMTEAILGDN
jgi:dihydropteroate synthase